MLKDILKTLRDSKGLTKKQVAAGIGITDRAYIAYEYGERDVSTDTLSKIADFYGVTTDYLLGRSETAPDPIDLLPIVDDTERRLVEQYFNLNPNLRKQFLSFIVNATK